MPARNLSAICKKECVSMQIKESIYHSSILKSGHIKKGKPLHRDDGFAVFRNKSGTQLEKIKQKLQRLFKEYDLEIIAESNQKFVNYLDVTLDLKDGIFRPYHKRSDQMQYIHTESNHPPNIIKNIPASIETRLSNLSSTETIFKESTAHYENNLRQSRYNKKLSYKPTDTKHQKHSKHKRKITV